MAGPGGVAVGTGSVRAFWTTLSGVSGGGGGELRGVSAASVGRSAGARVRSISRGFRTSPGGADPGSEETGIPQLSQNASPSGTVAPQLAHVLLIRLRAPRRGNGTTLPLRRNSGDSHVGNSRARRGGLPTRSAPVQNLLANEAAAHVGALGNQGLGVPVRRLRSPRGSVDWTWPRSPGSPLPAGARRPVLPTSWPPSIRGAPWDSRVDRQVRVVEECRGVQQHLQRMRRSAAWGSGPRGSCRAASRRGRGGRRRGDRGHGVQPSPGRTASVTASPRRWRSTSRAGARPWRARLWHLGRSTARHRISTSLPPVAPATPPGLPSGLRR
jgi:hypothetical protein